MQELDFENKLSSWFRFRKQLETSKTPFKDVIKYYNATEKCNLSVDPWDQKTWPQGPWELLTQNKLCDLTHSLGVCYTLQLTDRFSGVKFEIHITLDEDNSHHYYLLHVGDRVLGYNKEKHINATEIKQNLISQSVFQMPARQ